VAAQALESGLVVNAVTSSAIRLAPSLLVSPAEIDEGAARLGQAIRDVADGAHPEGG
jgi:4-aminobutyrate aminotransferase-like enzyme